jgi:hypothetical protein
VPESGVALDRIIDTLLAVDPELDALSIAETVWLAARRTPADSPPPVVDLGTGTAAWPAAEPHGRLAAEPRVPVARAPAIPPPRDRDLYQVVGPRTTGRPVMRGRTVRAPRGQALPRSLDLGRSLRALKRRWRAGQRQELDLAATVDGYARSLELLPVFRAAPERWFELFVIVDRSASMAVWRQTIAELTDILRKSGAFRKLHVWDLDPETDGPVLRGPRGQPLTPEQLSAASGRRLAIVLSDCSADGWRGGGAWQLLREWSRVLAVALVNPLPPRLWRHTGLDLPAVRVGPAGVPGAPNTALAHEVSVTLEPAAAPDMTWVPIPALALTPHSLGRWARTVMRADTRGCDAVLIPSQALFSQLEAIEHDGYQTGTPQAEAAAIVDTFLHMASPRAVQLAALCTELDQVEVALLDIIRAELVPAAEVTDAAEVVTSGLFVIEADEQAGTVLHFRPDTRDRLRGMLSAHDAGRLTELLSAHIAMHAGSVAGFPVAAADPRGELDLPPGRPPIARATEETLRSLGSGPWPALARGSEKRSSAIGGSAEPALLDRPSLPSGVGAPPDTRPGRRPGAARDTAATSISLLGAPGSGKATYVTAVRHAVNRTDAATGRWALYPRTTASTDALIRWTQQLVSEGSFPQPTHAGDPTELVWRCRGDLAGSRYRRRGWLRRRASDVSEFDLDLIDVSGEMFGPDPANGGLPPGFADIAVRHLARAGGLVFLFDPVTGRDERTAAGYLSRVLTLLSRRVMAEGRLIGPYLPHYIAVCITKFDHKDVFRQAREAGLVNYGPDGMPRVLDSQARELFDAICEGRFWPDQRTDSHGGALFVRNQLRKYFHPDRIRYYAISSIGYKRPPAWDRQSARPGFQFDPGDFSNVIEQGGKQKILGPIEPVNVLEPLIDLHMQITGRA